MATPTEELLTRWTVRLAVVAYAWVLFKEVVPKTNSTRNTDRIIWSLGCGLFLWHTVCAFAFYHEWSHQAAYEHTAQQTEDLIGWDWGGGLYMNYVFTLIWVADVVWWWVSPEQREHSRKTRLTLHGFFLFMIFNATVVFGPRFWMIATMLYATVTGIRFRNRSR